MSLLTGWDYFVGLVLVLSVGFGLMRGLIRTVFALAAWIAAFLGLAWGTEPIVVALSMQAHVWVVVVVLFLVIFLLVRALGRWLATRIKAIGLGGIDRLLGATVGALRAALLIALAVVAARFLELDRQPAWQQALSRPLLEQTLRALEPHLPTSMTGLRQT